MAPQRSPRCAVAAARWHAARAARLCYRRRAPRTAACGAPLGMGRRAQTPNSRGERSARSTTRARLGRLRLLVAAQQRKVGDVDLAQDGAVQHARQHVLLDEAHIALHVDVPAPLDRQDKRHQARGEGVHQQPGAGARAWRASAARRTRPNLTGTGPKHPRAKQSPCAPEGAVAARVVRLAHEEPRHLAARPPSATRGVKGARRRAPDGVVRHGCCTGT